MKQLSQISFLQTFGILLVVLGHSFYRFSPETPVIRWIYGFHMPLFFFIAGYLMRYVHADPCAIPLWGRRGYITRRARRLLVPYMVISSLFFIPKALLGSYSVRPVTLSWHDYFYQLLLPYHNVLGAYWFMPTLFLIYAAFLLMARSATRLRLSHWAEGLLAVFLLANILVPLNHDTVLNLSGVLFYMVYFLVGYVYRASAAEAWLNRVNAWAELSLTFAFSILVLAVPSFIPDDSTAADLLLSSLDLLTALNGIALSIALARLYDVHHLHFLHHLYGATYYIYLFSSIFQVFALQGLLRFVSLPPAVYVPLAFLVGVYGPLVIYRCVSAHRH